MKFIQSLSVSFLFCGVIFSGTPNTPHYLPNGADLPKSKWAMSIEGDFLYWIAEQADMSFATIYKSTIAPQEVDVAYHTNPGYKVSASFLPNLDFTDITLRYTYYNQPGRWQSYTLDQNVTCSNNPHKKICNIESVDDEYLFGEIEHVKAIWPFQLWEADLEIGRSYKVSKYVFMRPYIGLKTVWQEQHFNIYYTLMPLLVDTNYWNIYSDQSSFGIGPRSGLEMKYRFSKRHGLSGNLCYTLLSTRIHNAVTDELAETYISETNYNFKRKISYIQPLIEAAFGFESVFQYDDATGLSLFFGWEFQYFFDNNYFMITPADKRTGDLSIQGLLVKARVSF